MSQGEAETATITDRPIAVGDGWRAVEVVCRSSAADRPFEERHGWTSVSAVLSGVFTYRSDRGRAVLAPGALLLGSAGACFQCGHEHGAGDRCAAFHFTPEFIDEVLAGSRRGPRPTFRSASLAASDKLLPLMAEARALTGAPDPLRAEQLALNLAGAAFAFDQDAEPAPVRLSEEARVVRAVRIIEARHAEPLTIAGLAAEVGLTRRRLTVAFRRAVGMTPYAYVLNRRLDAAARRLRAGAPSVLEVALETGFGDLSEFTRRFRARYGAPPRAYGVTTGKLGVKGSIRSTSAP